MKRLTILLMALSVAFGAMAQNQAVPSKAVDGVRSEAKKTDRHVRHPKTKHVDKSMGKDAKLRKNTINRTVNTSKATKVEPKKKVVREAEIKKEDPKLK